MPWRPAGPPDTANELGELQASEVLNISRLGEEISASLQCRNCEQNCTRNPPRHKWEYMRVEPQDNTNNTIRPLFCLGLIASAKH